MDTTTSPLTPPAIERDSTRVARRTIGPRCSCEASGGVLARCAMHGWVGRCDGPHLAWLLLRYPRDAAAIREAANRGALDQLEAAAALAETLDSPLTVRPPSQRSRR